VLFPHTDGAGERNRVQGHESGKVKRRNFLDRVPRRIADDDFRSLFKKQSRQKVKHKGAAAPDKG
jgi:hypothetical protein